MKQEMNSLKCEAEPGSVRSRRVSLVPPKTALDYRYLNSRLCLRRRGAYVWVYRRRGSESGHPMHFMDCKKFSRHPPASASVLVGIMLINKISFIFHLKREKARGSIQPQADGRLAARLLLMI